MVVHPLFGGDGVRIEESQVRVVDLKSKPVPHLYGTAQEGLKGLCVGNGLFAAQLKGRQTDVGRGRTGQ